MLFIHLIPQVEVIQRSAFCDEGSLVDAHPYLRKSARAPRFHPEAQRGTCFKRLYVLTDHAERKLPQRRDKHYPEGTWRRQIPTSLPSAPSLSLPIAPQSSSFPPESTSPIHRATACGHLLQSSCPSPISPPLPSRPAAHSAKPSGDFPKPCVRASPALCAGLRSAKESAPARSFHRWSDSIPNPLCELPCRSSVPPSRPTAKSRSWSRPAPSSCPAD